MGAATAGDLYRQAQHDIERGRHDDAYRLLRRALALASDPTDRALVLISLSYQEAEFRRLADGLARLDEAEALPGLPPRLHGLAASQRGLLYQRAGLLNQAADCFDRAVDLFGEAEPDDLCRNLINCGLTNMQRGRNRAARADFNRCVVLASQHGLDVLAAKASHNLGYLYMIAGDLPQSLRIMDEASPVLVAQSPIYAGIYHVDHAQALMAAGLFREADEHLNRATALFRTAHATHDLAEAELGRATLALLDQRWADAAELAGRARRRFAGRRTHTWAMVAAHVVIAARLGAGRHAGTAVRAAHLAGRMMAVGLVDEARRCLLTATLAAISGGSRHVDRATRLAGDAVRLRRDDPIVTRLQARTVRAALAEARGRRDQADRERRAALADLHRYQASFGSLDLQTAIGSHARQLANHGLARALAGGRPASVFSWAEHARALSARLPPVLPPTDDRAAAMLEELRQARLDLRAQSLAGQVNPALRVRCTQLEQAIRQRSWYTPGPAHTVAAVRLTSLREVLRAGSATLVAHLINDDHLHALVVTGRRQTLVDLGSADGVTEMQRRLRRDLDLLARDALPPHVRNTIRAARRSALDQLDAVLWQPLRPLLNGGPLLLAPSAQLATTPWTLLPTIRGMPVTVTASVTAWLSVRESRPMPDNPTVDFVVGPGLDRAHDEVRLLEQVWELSPRETASTAAELRTAAEHADILHIAAHGTHETDNPLFSHLTLADGPLFGYEFERLARLPNHVVLSACELGLAGVRPGDEALGMTVAILHHGTRSVVAGVASVSDASACHVARAYHAGLRRRQAPAVALAAAIDTIEEDPPPLVCFGAGW